MYWCCLFRGEVLFVVDFVTTSDDVRYHCNIMLSTAPGGSTVQCVAGGSLVKLLYLLMLKSHSECVLLVLLTLLLVALSLTVYRNVV